MHVSTKTNQYPIPNSVLYTLIHDRGMDSREKKPWIGNKFNFKSQELEAILLVIVLVWDPPEADAKTGICNGLLKPAGRGCQETGKGC